MNFYPRHYWKNKLAEAIGKHPIIGLLGPRQCGKTTLARDFIDDPDYFFDLEHPADLNRLQTDPAGILSEARGLVILDEIQHAPELFPILRYLVDQPSNRATFLLLGSASPELINKSGESLAGRISYLELGPFHLDEVGSTKQAELLVRGGYPRSFLASDLEQAFAWREDFINSYLGQDIPMLSNPRLSRMEMYRLLASLAEYHGQTINYASVSNIISRNQKTVRHYVHLFEGSYIVRLLPPFIYNTTKRLRKAPKVYFRDSGLVNCLLRIKESNPLNFPGSKIGFIWEGFAMEHVIRSLEARNVDCYYWSTQSGAEIDLIVDTFNGKFGFEFKYGHNPSTTKSMQIAKKELGLKHIYVIHSGRGIRSLGERITAVGLSSISSIN